MTRRPRLLVVYVRYWRTGLDDHVSWWCMNGIGVRTRRPRTCVSIAVGIVLSSVSTVLGHGTRRPRLLVVYGRFWGTRRPRILCMYGIGVRTRRTHLLVVYVRLWGTE